MTGAGPDAVAKCAAKRSASIVADVMTTRNSGRLARSFFR